MNITWYDKPRGVLINRLEEGWTWEELRDSLQTIHELAAQANGDAIFIIDVSRARSLPPGNTMVNGQYMMRQVPENVRHIVILIESKLVKTFMTMVIGMIPAWRNRAHFVKSLEEANKLIDRLLEQQVA